MSNPSYFYNEVDPAKVVELEALIDKSPFARSFTKTAHYRFLTAVNGSVKDAFHAMEAHSEWRLAINIESIRPEDFQNESVKKFLVIGEPDRKGRPTFYCIIHRHNKNERNLEEIKKLVVYHMEAATRISDPNEEKITIVADLHNFGMINMDFEFVKLLIEVLQVNYRECLNKFLVINAPWLFSTCWLIIKPWLDHRTVNKIMFLTNKQTLDNYVDISRVPPDIFIE